MTGSNDPIVEPVGKLLNRMGKDPEIGEQLRRAGEQELLREKLRKQAHLKRLFAHHPETILSETRKSIEGLTHVIAQVFGQRGITPDWFDDITESSKSSSIIASPVTYLERSFEIAVALSPERDKLDSIMAKDPVIQETAKAIKLAELAHAGKIKDATARDRIIHTARESERQRRAHIVRKYQLELLSVWGYELKLMRLRKEVLELESAIIYKLRGAIIGSIEELAKIAESPETEEILAQAKAMRMQAAYDSKGDDSEPANIEQVQRMRAKAQENEKSMVDRLEKNEQTIGELIDIENDLLQLLPTLNAKAEWKPVHRPVQKTGYGKGPGVKVKHKGRMAIQHGR